MQFWGGWTLHTVITNLCDLKQHNKFRSIPSDSSNFVPQTRFPASGYSALGTYAQQKKTPIIFFLLHRNRNLPRFLILLFLFLMVSVSSYFSRFCHGRSTILSFLCFIFRYKVICSDKIWDNGTHVSPYPGWFENCSFLLKLTKLHV